MKICGIICEFNPFHNGHAYLIEKAKEKSGCDAVLCIMSGNFTQRGEVCVFDKYVRAEHAVRGGADCVIQLPAPFAVAPAEIFAKGAIKILSSIPDVKYLAFGCENGDADFTAAAQILQDENEKFKEKLCEKLAGGESYIRSYASAFGYCGGDEKTVSAPNNILGLEYTKAILNSASHIKILPVERIGAGYGDGELKENYSSASAIRNNIRSQAVKSNLPEYVFKDLNIGYDGKDYGAFLRNCLFKADKDNLKRIFGCGEGLENRLKRLENLTVDEIIENATSRRYSSSRIKRILCANALELYGDDCKRFLESDLYIKPLAVNQRQAARTLAALSKSAYPVVTGIDTEKLTKTAKECFERDKNEFLTYKFLTRSDKKDYMTLIKR